MKTLKHLLKIADLSSELLSQIVSQSLEFDDCLIRGHDLASIAKLKRHGPVGLIFFEPSTRTRVSFERAAQELGRDTILLVTKGSSFEKGETLEDALENLRALKVNCFVIRTSETDGLEKLRGLKDVSLINAGDGVGEHPSQALLDLCTLARRHGGGRLEGLRGFKLGILGNLSHSRVARSWSELSPRVGIDLTLISPEEWKPKDWLALDGSGPVKWTSKKSLGNVDALMALRVQNERFNEGEGRSRDFVAEYGVKLSDLKASQTLLHPGPVNWGVELVNEWRTDPRSLILEQVRMGLALRAVILDSLENG